MVVFTLFHQPGWKFISIGTDGIPILADQYNLVLFLPIKAVNDHSIRRILTCGKLHFLFRLCPGCHKIIHRCIMDTGCFYIVKIQICIICQLPNLVDLAHNDLFSLYQSPRRTTRILL